jgi:hypothetical protein
MSAEELREASAKLARLVGELAAMEIDHAEIRKEQKTERDMLASDVQSLAATVRQQGR